MLGNVRQVKQINSSAIQPPTVVVVVVVAISDR